jgi:hypothetical protein
MNRRIGKAVKEQIYFAQLHHQISDVVAGDVRVNPLTLIERELVARDI